MKNIITLGLTLALGFSCLGQGNTYFGNFNGNAGNSTNGGLTNLQAVNLTGLVPTANLGTGSASSTTFLRGDQTYATPAGSSGVVSVAVTNTPGATNGISAEISGTALGITQTIASNLPVVGTAVVTNPSPYYLTINTASGITSVAVTNVTGATAGLSSEVTGSALGLTMTNLSGSGSGVTSVNVTNTPAATNGISAEVSGTVMGITQSISTNISGNAGFATNAATANSAGTPVFVSTNGYGSLNLNGAAPLSFGSAASGTTYYNSQPYNIEVYLYNNATAGSMTVFKNGGIIFSVFLKGDATFTFHLQPGEYYRSSYTSGSAVAYFSPE